MVLIDKFLQLSINHQIQCGIIIVMIISIIMMLSLTVITIVIQHIVLSKYFRELLQKEENSLINNIDILTDMILQSIEFSSKYEVYFINSLTI